MRIAVAGATGMIGLPVVHQLEARGHQVRRLSRHSPDFGVDVSSGLGLHAALTDVDVVVNATNGPPNRRAETILLDGVRQLAAAARDAHHVLVSIVGVDQVPGAYYGLKLRQEQILRELGVRFSIIRSTQFHEFIGGGLAKVGRLGIELHSDIQFQPIRARDAAAVVSRFAVGEPTGAISTVAGPQILSLTQMRARRGLPVPLPLPPGLKRALLAGGLTDPQPDIRGVQTYHQWLAELRGEAWLGGNITPGPPIANRFKR